MVGSMVALHMITTVGTIKATIRITPEVVEVEVVTRKGTSNGIVVVDMVVEGNITWLSNTDRMVVPRIHTSRHELAMVLDFSNNNSIITMANNKTTINKEDITSMEDPVVGTKMTFELAQNSLFRTTSLLGFV